MHLIHPFSSPTTLLLVNSHGISKMRKVNLFLLVFLLTLACVVSNVVIAYTAHEIVEDERYIKSVDLWVLGCVLLMMTVLVFRRRK